MVQIKTRQRNEIQYLEIIVNSIMFNWNSLVSAEFQSFVNDGERINKALYEIEVMAVADYSEYML
jgi:hypothetical protein